MFSISTDTTPGQSRNAGRTRGGALAFAACLLIASNAAADDKPVGTATSSDGAVHLNILSLKHSEGDTVTLKYEMANDGSSDYSMTPNNIRLIDLVGRRTYDAGLSGGCGRTPPGKRETCWAIFAAPPPAAKTISVMFYENSTLISGVPVTE